MPVLVIADLHLDHWLHASRPPLSSLPRDLLDALDWAARIWPEPVLVK